MGKHRKRVYVQPAKQWYQQTALVVGVVGILLLIGLFFLVNAAFSTDTGEPPVQSTQQAEIQGNHQVIRMSVESIDYVPSSFTVKEDVPVRFVVDGTRASGCTSIIVSRDFGFNQRLQKGENIIEFTPTQKGTYVFHCGMNMVQGTITVV